MRNIALKFMIKKLKKRRNYYRDLIFEDKRQRSTTKKNLIVNLLELILAKKIMMQIMKLV